MERLPFEDNGWDDMGNYYEGDLNSLDKPVEPVTDWPPYVPPGSNNVEAPNGWSDPKEYYEAHLPFEGFRG